MALAPIGLIVYAAVEWGQPFWHAALGVVLCGGGAWCAWQLANSELAKIGPSTDAADAFAARLVLPESTSIPLLAVRVCGDEPWLILATLQLATVPLALVCTVGVLAGASAAAAAKGWPTVVGGVVGGSVGFGGWIYSVMTTGLRASSVGAEAAGERAVYRCRVRGWPRIRGRVTRLRVRAAFPHHVNVYKSPAVIDAVVGWIRERLAEHPRERNAAETREPAP